MSTSRFPVNSRYKDIQTAEMETADGKIIVYLRRRFVPFAEKHELLQEHTVRDEERLDQIAARYLGDPEQFWRICDANNAMDPNELLETGRRLRITLPEGIAGQQNE